MASRKYDEKAAEQEYVTTTVSVRTLAAKHNVSFSTLAAKARSEDWKGKRIAYQAAMARRTYETMAVQAANEESVIRTESVAVLRATLRRYAELLASGSVNVTTKDAVDAVKTLSVLMGDPGSREDEKVESARNVTRPDADHLRRIAEVARRRLSGGEILEGIAVDQPAAARAN